MRAPLIPPGELSPQQLTLYKNIKPFITSHLPNFETENKDGALIGPWSVWLQDPRLGSPIWEATKAVNTNLVLPEAVRQVAILKVGSHFEAAYEVYAHSGVSSAVGIDQSQVESLAKGKCPPNLGQKETCAFDVAQALIGGGVLPDELYEKSIKFLTRQGTAELIHLIGVYCLVSVTLNGFDVKAPATEAKDDDHLAPTATKPFQHDIYQTLNPTTEQVEQVFQGTTDKEVSTALGKAHQTYQMDWRLRPVSERASYVAKAAGLLRDQKEAFAQLMTREMGKLIGQSRWEVDLTADILDYYASHGEEFLATKPLPEVSNAVVATEPIGVILAIEPWNFPLYQLVRVAAPQIVAGNVVIFKHASNVPQCAMAFARLFEEAGTPQGVYTNLLCSIDQVNTLIDDIRVRGVTLTGSERAGASVAERAGRKMKKVVLELGGSDPLIVLPDADLEHVTSQGLAGRMMCMGQACAASKRFIVVGKQRGQVLLEKMVESIRAMKVGDPADPETSLGPLSSQRALEGLLGQISMAKSHGARVLVGGNRIDRPGWYLEPTIVTDIARNNPLFGEETFGPVISYYVVDSEDEAIELANATSFGLGASIFGEPAYARKLVPRIEAGMVWINTTASTAAEMPFGGVKNSGFGRELFELGIGEFVNRKLIQVAA